MSELSVASHGPGRFATPITRSFACSTSRMLSLIIAFHFAPCAASWAPIPSLTPTNPAERMPTAMRPPSIPSWPALRAPLGTVRYLSRPRTSWKPPKRSGPHAIR